MWDLWLKLLAVVFNTSDCSNLPLAFVRVVHKQQLSSRDLLWRCPLKEMEPSTTHGNQDLAQFWEEIPQNKMKQRLKSRVLQDVKPTLRLTTNNYETPATSNEHQNLRATLLQVMASSSRLEQKLDRCLWAQKVFIVLVACLTALWVFTLYVCYITGSSSRTTAKN